MSRTEKLRQSFIDDLLKTEKIKSWKETRKGHSKLEIAGPGQKGESDPVNSLHDIFNFLRVTRVRFAAPYQRNQAPILHSSFLLHKKRKVRYERTSRFQNDCDCIRGTAACTWRFRT